MMGRLDDLKKAYEEEEERLKLAKKELQVSKMKIQRDDLKKKKKQDLQQYDNLSVHLPQHQETLQKMEDT